MIENFTLKYKLFGIFYYYYFNIYHEKKKNITIVRVCMYTEERYFLPHL